MVGDGDPQVGERSAKAVDPARAGKSVGTRRTRNGAGLRNGQRRARRDADDLRRFGR